MYVNRKLTMATIMVGVIFTANLALAGFEWKPATTGNPTGLTAFPAAPAVAQEPLAGELKMPANPAPELTTPTNSAIAPAQPRLQPDRPAATPLSSGGEMVAGFGTQIPLVLAMQQILPTSLEAAFADGVNVTTPVSWQGGKPWRDTLRDILAPLGLAALESNQVVMITPSSNNVRLQSGPAVPLAAPAPVAETAQPVSPLQQKQLWYAEKGAKLRDVLDVWSSMVGVEVQWLSEYDFPLAASVNIPGTYEQAVRTLLRGFREASPQPVATLHRNQEAGQSLLVVRSRGNDYNPE